MSDMPEVIWVHKQSEIIASVKPEGLMSSLYDEYTRTDLVPQWISVRDKEPQDDSLRVLWLVEGCTYLTSLSALVLDIDFDRYQEGDTVYDFESAHWMPIPALPEPT